ncbi:MAG: DNA repair protein [Ruminococcus sp.]|nr:DNA repair protein [Ruminococcus sp.]
MAEKNLKKLKRAELLEIMVNQSKRIDELEAENEILKQKIKSKEIAIDEAGTIADAALKLNRVFEAAQAAANQYLENVKLLCNNQEENK